MKNNILRTFIRIIYAVITLIFMGIIISAAYIKMSKSQNYSSETFSSDSIYNEYIKKFTNEYIKNSTNEKNNNLTTIENNIEEKSSEENKNEEFSEKTNEENEDIYIPENIRVLISYEGNYYYNNVQITCDTEFSVTYGDIVMHYGAGDIFDVNSYVADNIVSDDNPDKTDNIILDDNPDKTDNIVSDDNPDKTDNIISDDNSNNTDNQITDICIEAGKEDGKLQILSIKKNDENPSYRGKIYITTSEASGSAIYTIINELPLEEYLYSVVSSEMPSSFEKEALKAQAVCARSYAINKINEKSYEEYGADVDDTTSCQMYNNIPETEASINAVKETCGIVAEYDGEIIQTYFYSASCGTTCSNADVWTGDSLPYLTNSLELYGDTELKDQDINTETEEKAILSYNNSYILSADGITFSSEKLFQDFINNKLYIDTVEKDIPMYRWTVEYTSEQMIETISAFLTDMENEASDQIYVSWNDEALLDNQTDNKTDNKTDSKTDNQTDSQTDSQDNTEDKWTYLNIENDNIDLAWLIENDMLLTCINSIDNISVAGRGDSGIALSVTIHCPYVDITVSGQYLIRQLFSPELTEIITQDKNELTGWSMLPSAYFYIEKNPDDSYTIFGGGYGHGVGMSQNGANVLAASGWDYKEILEYYFPGAAIGLTLSK